LKLSNDAIFSNFQHKIIPEQLILKYNKELREQLLSIYPQKEKEINKLEYKYFDGKKSKLVVNKKAKEKFIFTFKPDNKLNINSKEQLEFYLRNSQKIYKVDLKSIKYDIGDGIEIDDGIFFKSYDDISTEKILFIKAMEFTKEDNIVLLISNNPTILLRVPYDSAEFSKYEYIDNKNRYKINFYIRYDFSEIKINFSSNLIENDNGWCIEEVIEVLRVHKAFLEQDIKLKNGYKLQFNERDDKKLDYIDNEINDLLKISLLEDNLRNKFKVIFPYSKDDFASLLILYRGLVKNELISTQEKYEKIIISNPNFDLNSNKNKDMILCSYSEYEQITIWGVDIKFKLAKYLVDLNFYDYKKVDNGYQLLLNQEIKDNMQTVLQYSLNEITFIDDRDVLLDL